MNALDTFSLATLLALVYVVVNFLRSVTSIGKDPKALNAVVTQIIVWIAGFLVILIAAQASIANTIPVFGTRLADLDFASIILVGLSVGSAASVGNDVLGALDNTRTSKTPTLLDVGNGGALTEDI